MRLMTRRGFCLVSSSLVGLGPALARAGGQPRRRTPKLAFDGESYDFEFRRLLGYTVSGGADLNEAMMTARQIKDGDAESWFKHWSALARQMAGVAERSLARGHRVSAREALLRASNYHRAAGFYLVGNPSDKRVIDSWRHSRDAFRRATKLMDRPVETVRIPYQGTTLPGYVLRADESRSPRKTLIVQTGFDGTGEELYFGYAFFALARGYNVLIFEGPGQGGALHEQKLHFRPDWEKVVTPVVDFALKRPEVDPRRLALIGNSMGGYLAPRAAAFEHRLAAVIANPGAYDLYGNNALSAKSWAAFERYPDRTNQELQKRMKRDVGFRWWIQNGMLTLGVKTPLQFMQRWRQYTLKGLARRIKCPTLVVVSEGDHFFSVAAQQRLYDKLRCPKTLLKFSQQDFAPFHCQMGSKMVGNQRILDWLDETLARG